MAVLSGVLAKIMIGSSTVIECVSWNINFEAAVSPYASCNTAGYRKRTTGVKDCTGEISGLIDSSDHIFNYFTEGDEVTLLLYKDATTYHSIPAVIENVNEGDYDRDSSDPVRWSASFGGNGAPSKNQT